MINIVKKASKLVIFLALAGERFTASLIRQTSLKLNFQVFVTTFKRGILALKFKKIAACFALICFNVNSFAVTCSIPGNSGPATVAAYQNGLYPGIVGTSVGAGATSIPVGALRSGTAAQAGTLLLIIQMQGATINSTNSAQYGDGAGSGAVAPASPPAALPTAAFRTDVFGTANYAGGSITNTAGTYEYVVAAGAAAGGSIPIASALVNSYSNLAATGAQGQTRYQVVVIQQHSSATYSGTHTIPAWDGSSGGIEAIDVAGALTLSALTINGNARGFRGGGGENHNALCTQQLANTGILVCQDYRQTNASTYGGFKGEGIAGTPALVYSNVTSTNTGAGGGADGYPNGDRSRGAPGNAGGGGNQHNAGGGGGGNGGAGGKGGRSWNGTGSVTAAYSGEEVGGFGGASGYNSATRLVMGGGGGAGDVGGNTSTPIEAGAGGAGGALVIIRAGSIAGAATINVNGGVGIGSSATDAGGGGGAGGTVMVTTGTGAAAGITVNAIGGAGAGGNMGGSIETDGPGGGGGGGQLLSNGGGALTATGGAAGTIANGTNITCGTGSSCGATAGAVGGSIGISSPIASTGVYAGYECLPNISATKITSTPVFDLLGAATGVANYQIDLVNSGGGARAVNIIDNALPPGWVLVGTPTYTYQLTPPIAANNLPSGADSSAVPTVNPVAGAPVTAPALGANSLTWGGFFMAPLKNDVPTRVRINFSATIPTTAPVGCFHNPVGFNYLDSTRSTATRTVTPTTNNATNRAAAAYSANVTYETRASVANPTPVAGDNYSGLAAGSTGEDVCVRPDLLITKTNSTATPALGVGYNYTITARNNGHTIRDVAYAADQTSPLTAGAIGPNLTNLVTDTLPTGVQLTAPPTGTNWTCTGIAGDTTFACSYTGAYPWAAATDLVGAITVPVVATLAACPAVKINTALLNQAQFPGNGLAGTSLEFNTANNTATDGAGITPNCNASVTITKTDGKNVSVQGTLNTYTINVTNQGPAAANGATISDSPSAGLTCPGALGAATVACTASNGAQCPGAAAVNTPSTVTYAAFNAGVVTPTLPATGVLTFSYQCTVN